MWDGADADVGWEEAVPGMRVPSDVLRHRLRRVVLWLTVMWIAWAWFSTLGIRGTRFFLPAPSISNE